MEWKADHHREGTRTREMRYLLNTDTTAPIFRNRRAAETSWNPGSFLTSVQLANHSVKWVWMSACPFLESYRNGSVQPSLSAVEKVRGVGGGYGHFHCPTSMSEEKYSHLTNSWVKNLDVHLVTTLMRALSFMSLWDIMIHFRILFWHFMTKLITCSSGKIIFMPFINQNSHSSCVSLGQCFNLKVYICTHVNFFKGCTCGYLTGASCCVSTLLISVWCCLIFTVTFSNYTPPPLLIFSKNCEWGGSFSFFFFSICR